jgi:hypothetical protein
MKATIIVTSFNRICSSNDNMKAEAIIIDVNSNNKISIYMREIEQKYY